MNTTQCFEPFEYNLDLCMASIEGRVVPTKPNPVNENMRRLICSTKECQELFRVFRQLIADNCTAAVQEAKEYPEGIWTTTYCPPPLNVTTAPNATYVTEAPVRTVPQPTILVPSPIVKRPEEEMTSGETTILRIGGGAVLVIAVLLVLLAVRRYRKRVAEERVKCQVQAFAYIEDTAGDSHGDDTSASGLIVIDEVLAAVRIPFDKIRVGEVISIGGYGEVARGVYNKRLVAIKRLPAGRRKDPGSIQSLLEEIRLTSTLEHECVVQFIGVAWDTPSDLCMISEFMPGGDLRLLLAKFAKSGHPNGHDDAKLKIAVQVAHALAYLHTLATPVVHRDLKSRNVLLSAKGDAKLIDFGISCERQDVTMTAGVGTSLWMAPEVMLGQRYDEKADVFSFGVILSELDTHALPYYHARDPVSDRKMADMVLMQLISEGKLTPRFTENADPQIVALAKECLRHDPAERPSVTEVLFRIHECRENEFML